MIDAAVLSALENGGELGEIAAAFLLPSHFVWLSKRNYDQKNYPESIRLAREALKGAGRLSSGGIVAASRYLCLSASRIGEDGTYLEGMTVLLRSANDDWARSNIAYLKGFNFRFKGNLPDAETEFREAFRLSPGNVHAAREIAAICLARGNLDEAEAFAREALGHGEGNPYLLDILIAVLIRRTGKSAKNSPEIAELFDSLEKVGEGAGQSFFTTRKAEFEHLWGDNRLALDLINKAIKKTPKIFEAQRLRAEILLKDGRKTHAADAIAAMRDIVNARDPDERRSNYRGYLVTFSHYLQEIGQYAEAKAIYDDKSIFTDTERAVAIREIEILQSYRAR